MFNLIEVLETEELSDVILVGHSFGGVPIFGVADRAPEKIRHLVYLDSVVLESGQSGFSVYPPKEVEERIEASNKANGGLAVPNPKALPPSWGFTEGTADYAWVTRRITPTPLRAYTTALDLHAAIVNGLPKTYIHCNKAREPCAGEVAGSGEILIRLELDRLSRSARQHDYPAGRDPGAAAANLTDD